jgi:hypothetical protein
MIKFEHNNKPAKAMQPAFANAMFIDYRAQEDNTSGALIM